MMMIILIILMIIHDGNWTVWRTIQGVIGRVISNLSGSMVRVFWKLCQEIAAPFVPVPEVTEILLQKDLILPTWPMNERELFV